MYESNAEGLMVVFFIGGLILWGCAYGMYDDYRNSAEYQEKMDAKNCKKLLRKRKEAIKKAKKATAKRKLRIKSGKITVRKVFGDFTYGVWKCHECNFKTFPQVIKSKNYFLERKNWGKDKEFVLFPTCPYCKTYLSYYEDPSLGKLKRGSWDGKKWLADEWDGKFWIPTNKEWDAKKAAKIRKA